MSKAYVLDAVSQFGLLNSCLNGAVLCCAVLCRAVLRWAGLWYIAAKVAPQMNFGFACFAHCACLLSIAASQAKFWQAA